MKSLPKGMERPPAEAVKRSEEDRPRPKSLTVSDYDYPGYIRRLIEDNKKVDVNIVKFVVEENKGGSPAVQILLTVNGVKTHEKTEARG